MQAANIMKFPDLEQLIKPSPLTVTADTTVKDVIGLMNQETSSSYNSINIEETFEINSFNQETHSCVLVIEGKRLLGIFTERDVVRLTGRDTNLLRLTISEVMTQPVISLILSPSQNTFNAFSLMQQHRIRHLPVVNQEGQLLGLITQMQVFDYLEDLLSHAQKQLQMSKETAELVHANSRLNQEIEKQRQLQNILENNEQRLLLALSSANTGTWDWNLQTNQVIWSDHLFSLFGVTPETFDVSYENFLNLVHPEDRILLQQTVMRSIHERIPYDIEFRVVCPDGTVRWSAVKGKVFYDDTGQPLRMIGLNIDITEQKAALRDRQQAEEAAQISEARLRAIIDNSPAAIYVKDLQGYHILVNSEFERITHLTREQTKNKTNFDIFPQETAEVFTRNDQNVLNTLKSWKFEEDILIDEKLHTFLTVKFPLCDACGQPYAICGISTEITDRKQAEQKIREQAALIDIATDAIFVHDLASHILFWSQGAERLYGWNAEESLGKNAHELFSKESRSQLEVGINTTITKGAWSGELEQITKTGKAIIVASRWTLVHDQSGQPESILVVNTDITEKKQLEAQFYRAQRLESLGTLASGIAHDLNNVFAPIVMIAQLLPLKFKDVDERTQELFSTLENSSKRGANLVKQILTFACGTEGKRTILQTGHLLKGVVQVIKQTFPKCIEIRSDIPLDTLGMVKADPTQLDQVFMNLALNARDAMPHGGILKFSAANCIIDETYAQMQLDAQPGNYIVVTVSDTGTGISPEFLGRIFEPFFTTKEVGQGTGLGLATVFGIIKNHGGFVQVQSELGKGTQFQVYLPIAAGTVTETMIETELPKGHGELILIVDDEIVIQQTTKTALEDYNYKTLIANDGIEAIALYVKNRQDISVVFTDMIMPNMDGFTLIRTLQTINPQIKIMATSGLPMDAQKVFAVGVKAFLLKPYTAKDLLNNLSTLISTRP